MNWFWKKWFFDNGVPDLAITSATKGAGAVTIVVTSVGTKPVPVDLLVTYSDNSTEKIHRSIAVWEKGQRTCTVKVATTKQASKITLGDVHTPDGNIKDNTYQFK